MEILWQKMLQALYKSKQTFPTTPKNSRAPVLFTAWSDTSNIYVEGANGHPNSAKITGYRVLPKKEFLEVYPLFLRRENGENIIKEVEKITFNKVYWFSLMKHLLDKI